MPRNMADKLQWKDFGSGDSYLRMACRNCGRKYQKKGNGATSRTDNCDTVRCVGERKLTFGKATTTLFKTIGMPFSAPHHPTRAV